MIIPFSNIILGTVFRSARICVFKSCRRSSSYDFLVVWVFESMHIVGLFFVVLPELDVVKGAMLTNCLCFIPAILGRKLQMQGGYNYVFANGHIKYLFSIF